MVNILYLNIVTVNDLVSLELDYPISSKILYPQYIRDHSTIDSARRWNLSRIGCGKLNSQIDSRPVGVHGDRLYIAAVASQDYQDQQQNK